MFLANAFETVTKSWYGTSVTETKPILKFSLSFKRPVAGWSLH